MVLPPPSFIDELQHRLCNLNNAPCPAHPGKFQVHRDSLKKLKARGNGSGHSIAALPRDPGEHTEILPKSVVIVQPRYVPGRTACFTEPEAGCGGRI